MVELARKSTDTPETPRCRSKKFEKIFKKLLTKGFDGDIIDKLT